MEQVFTREATESRQRLRHVKTLVAPTQKVEDALQSYGLHVPISVVPSGISLEQHHQRLSTEERLERRRALGIADDDQVLLNLGRLGGEKNLGELVTLFAEARQENDKLKFLIVGDGPAKEDLEKQAKKLGVEDYVIFTGMDIKGARMWTGAKKAIEEGQKNVAFLRTNIEIIDRFFAEDEVR